MSLATKLLDLWYLFCGESRTLRILKRIGHERLEKHRSGTGGTIDRTWLLPYRSELRWLIEHGDTWSIWYYWYYCDYPQEMEPLCIWLIGKQADITRFYGFGEHLADPSPQIRWHIAKAFRRVQAWSLLKKMAQLNPRDARIHRLIRLAPAPIPRRSFNERLKSYALSVDDSQASEVATPSRMSYWAKDQSWECTPPKSRDFIRRMLRRIRHWVRWGVT